MRGVREPADEVVQELLGGLVDPVEVLDDEDEGTHLALRMKRSRRASKIFSLFSLGSSLRYVSSSDLEGEEVVERGRRFEAHRGTRPSPSSSS